MTPAELRQRRKQLYESSKAYPPHLVDVPESQWPPQFDFIAPKPFKVMRSRYFLLQAFSEPTGEIRLSICRTELDNDGEWKADICWDDLQSLKRQAGYGNYDAFEIFPPDKDLVNVANMRHLWIPVEPIPCAWRATHTP